MKNKSLANVLIANLVKTLGILVALNCASARANSDLDRQYALQTIGTLRAHDNVDGLFADYVSVAYKEYFARQARFTQNDLSKADALLITSKLPYSKLIEDPEVLSQLARATRTESLIRTKIYKEGPRYRFQLDWLHSPHMDLLSTDTFSLQEPASGQSFGMSELKTALHSSLDRLIAKVPFIGNVTGRDGNSVTVSLGYNPDLKKGDELKIGTLEEVKKHPLLKTIVDWRFASTGKLKVEQVEEGVAFCRVVDEEPGRRIAKYQKITQWLAVAPETKKETVIIETEEETRSRRMSEAPSLGWGSMGLWMGSLSRDYSQGTGNVSKGGSGFLFGVKFDGQVWLTREWFGELNFMAGASSYSQSDLTTGTPSAKASVNSSLVGVKFAAGYSFFASNDFFGPRGYVKLGFQSYRFSLPIDAAEFTSPTTFSGLLIGVGGDLPIRADFGALLTLDFGIGASGEQTGLPLGSATGATAVSFFVGGYKQFTPRLRAKVGIDAVLCGADYAENAGTSISQRAISFAPSLVYFF